MARCPESHKGVTGEVVKILLLGESNEQKQALLKAYCGDSETDQLRLLSSIGFTVRTKVITHPRSVTLQIWDTAGQGRFKTLAPAYVRAAKGLALCYDASDPESFRKIEHWLQQLLRLGVTASAKILIASQGGKVPREDGETLAAMFGMSFFEVGEDAASAFEHLVSLATPQAREVPREVRPNPKAVSIEDGRALAAKWGMALFESTPGLDVLPLTDLMVFSVPEKAYAGALSRLMSSVYQTPLGWLNSRKQISK